MVHVYLSEFIKKYLQKFQERLRNLSLDGNKMRRNTATYGTTADFANRETCSFIRLNYPGLNDAFRKTLLQVAKKKSKKIN